MKNKKMLKMKITIFCLFCLFCLYNTSFCEDREKIAVMDIRAYGVEKEVATTVNEFIRNDLFEMGKYDVIERSQIELVLKEQRLQLTGALNSKEVIKVGEILGVKKIILGSFSRLKQKYFLILRIVDVENARVLSSKTEECTSENELREMSKKIVSRLVSAAIIFKTKTEEEELRLRYGELDDKINNNMGDSSRDTYTPLGIANGIGCGALMSSLLNKSKLNPYIITGGGVIGGLLGYRNGKSIDRAKAILTVYPEIKEISESEKGAGWSIASTIIGLPYGLVAGVIATAITNSWESQGWIVVGIIGGGVGGYIIGNNIDRSDAINRIYSREYKGKKLSFYFYQNDGTKYAGINIDY
ncbi:MAG: CsgG/HfaB family protein [Elusimicrobiota bacterium]